MIMDQNCCTPPEKPLLLSCSGGSNVGQLANRAAVELTQEGFGKMSCLAGIGAHLSGFVHSAQNASELIVIDGCEIGCGQGIIQQAEVPLKNCLVLTDLGIVKNKDFNLSREDIDKVKEAVKASLQNKTKSSACSWPPSLVQEVILPIEKKPSGSPCCG
jgi:uncharacterized metal-binding protein